MHTIVGNEPQALPSEQRKARVMIWFGMAGLAAGACALVWAGITMMGVGNPDTVYIGKWMLAAGTMIVLLGSQVEI